MSYQLLYDGDGSSPVSADIWFVHGLRGDSIETWTKGSVCWPKDLLKEDTKNCRIFTWSYDSQVANITGSASHATIFGHAESFLQDIAMTRETTSEAEIPLVFVGHSLGGLVIKEALIRSSEYLFNQQDTELGSIYASTKGVVFLGTPHRGSELTTYGHIVAKVAKVVWRQPNDHLISMLEKESAILEKQRKSFASISKDFSLACLYEELPTKLGVVVPEWSAVIDGFNVKQYPIPGDHIDMCKFGTRGDAGYKRVTFLIKSIIKKEFQARVQFLAVMTQALLLSLDFSAMDLREDGLDAAHDKTFEWFLKNPAPPDQWVAPLREWFRSNESIFWISGKAGCGKSTLMKYAITAPQTPIILEDEFPEKRRIVASHYLYERGKDPLQKSREGLLRHLLYHIIYQDPALAKPIFKHLKAVHSFDSEKIWSWKELKTALELVLGAIRPDTVVLLFIDGLDEYRAIRKLESLDLDDEDEDMDEGLAEAITDGHQEIADLMLSISRHSHVRLCVSSRPLIVFQDGFKGFKIMELHTKTSEDIKQYVSDQLAGNPLLTQLTILEPKFEEDVKSEILLKADGVFLWVKLVMGIIIRGLRQRDTVEELLFKIRSMPKELGGKSGLYMAMLRNISLENRKEGFKYFQILQKSEFELDPLFVSFATGNENEVYTMSMYSLGSDEMRARRTRTAERLLTRCGGLLEVKTNSYSSRFAKAYGNHVTVSFIHQTAKEFVTKRSNWELLLGASIQKSFDGSLALQRAAVMLLKRSKPIHEERTEEGLYTIWDRLLFCFDCASLTDLSSRDASAKLVLLADRVVFNLYRPRELCDYSLTDYPTRSSFRSDRNGGEGPSVQELSSHLTPCKTKSNMISPIRPHHWSVLDPFASNVPKHKSLMAVAVQSNLSSFLETMSQRSDITITSPQEYPLLAYGVVPFRIDSTIKDSDARLGINQCDSRTTLLLLQSGENPNQQYSGPAYYQDCTIWQGVLVYGDLLYETWVWNQGPTGKEGNFQKFPRWVENAKLLITWGADVNTTCAVADRKFPLEVSEQTYRHRSSLFVMTIILWRVARSQGWHKDALLLMVAKGATLGEGEREDLLEIAEKVKIPQPLIRSFSEIVLEGMGNGDNVAGASSKPTPERRFLAPFLRPHSASGTSSQMSINVASGRSSNSSFHVLPADSPEFTGPQSHTTSGWRQQRDKVKKRLRRLFVQ